MLEMSEKRTESRANCGEGYICVRRKKSLLGVNYKGMEKEQKTQMSLV